MLSNRITALTLTLALALIPAIASGNSLHRISTAEGLSNNSVFSLYQDSLGHLWIGTTDGLNIWDGHSLELFNPKDGKNFFAGNTIRDIHPDGKDGIWLRTYYGLAHINTKTRTIKYYDSLSYAPYMACGYDGTPYVIASDRSLCYYDVNSDTFVRSKGKFINQKEHLKRLHRFGKDSLYCFTNKGIYLIRSKENELTKERNLILEKTIHTNISFVSATPEEDICHFASEHTKDIFTFNMKTGEICLYAEIGNSVPADEVFRALLPYKGSILAGFSVSGVYIAPPRPSKKFYTNCLKF